MLNVFFCFIAFAFLVFSLKYSQFTQEVAWGPDAGPLPFVSFLPIVLLMPAAIVRRLHDSGRTGWWILTSLVPFGFLVLFALLLIPGQSGENQYGAPERNP